MFQDFRRPTQNEADILPPIPGDIRKADGTYSDVLTELGVTGTEVHPGNGKVSTVKAGGKRYNLSELLARIGRAIGLDVMEARGDIIYRNATVPARLAKGTAGQVLTQGANDPAWGNPGDLAFVDTESAYNTDTIGAAFAQIAPKLEPDRFQYFIRDALPTEEADNFEGMAVYNTTDHTFQVCTTPGEQEVDTLTVTGPATKAGASNITITLNDEPVVLAVNGGTLEVRNATITAGASASGNLTLTLNGANTTVAVVAGDTAAQVAGKITAALAANANWTVGNADAVLTFTAKAVGPKAGSFFLAPAATGVTCTGGITLTTLGVIADTAPVVAGKIKEACDLAFYDVGGNTWDTAINGATLTFTKGVIGTANAPTAVDTGSSGVTFSAFARTNEGVAAVWDSLINAS